MNSEPNTLKSYEISPRFRNSLEDRITRLVRDADADELMLAHLECADHLRRHRRLIAVQRAEALRIRLFLDRTQSRMPRPFIPL